MIRRFESLVYDTDYVNEVEKVISAVNSSGLKELRNSLGLLPLYCGEFKLGYDSEKHISVRGMDEEEENLFFKLNKFIRSEHFQNWVDETEDFKYAFALDIGYPNRVNTENPKMINCYFNPDYMPAESDGEEATYVSKSSLEYDFNFQKSILTLLKNLSNIGYSLYTYQGIYIIIENEALKTI